MSITFEFLLIGMTESSDSPDATTLVILASTKDIIPVLIPSYVIEYSEFELPSTIEQFPRLTFANYFALKSIVIPASVKIIDQFCLCKLAALSSVEFESGSQLVEISLASFQFVPV
jgi:hypothetical protein